MKGLILLYWGTIFLMYLSQFYYPSRQQLSGPHSGRSSFLREKSDIFMVLVIAWMTCFSFLRTSYNDSLLSSKLQKNMSEKWLLFKKATFSDCIEGSFL